MIIKKEHALIIEAYPLQQSKTMEYLKQEINKAIRFDYINVDYWKDLWNNFDVNSIMNMETLNKIKDILDKISNPLKEIYDRGTKFLEEDLKPSSEMSYQWVLPIPGNWLDNVTHEFSENSLSVGSMLATQTQFLMATAINEKVGELSKRGVESFVRIGKRKNVILNPQTVNTYSGTKLRTLNVDVSLIPQNQQHYNEIIAGLIAFKYFMSGDAPLDSTFISQKAVFKILPQNEKIKQMFDINDVFWNLSELSIEYGRDGNFLINNQGAVKHIGLHLTFIERKPKYNNPNEDTKDIVR